MSAIVKISVMALILLSASTQSQAAEPPPAQLGIAPPRIEIDMEGRTNNESITIFNYSEKPKTIDLELINMSKIPNGKVIAPGPQTLSRWTLFNPKRFTIAPGESQTVRMSIRPRTKLESGTRYALLSIKQDMSNRAKASQSENGDLTVSIGSNYGMPVIVHIP